MVDYELLDNLMINKSYKKAKNEIDKLLIIYPEDFILNRKKVEVLCKLGLFKEAEDLIAKSGKISNMEKQRVKGILEESKLNIEKALKHYQKSISFGIEEDHISVAKLYEDIGNLEQAKIHYTEVEHNPRVRIYTLLGRGRIAARENNTNLSEQYLEETLEFETKSDYGIRELMRLAIYIGDYEKAYDYMCMLPISSQQRLKSKAKIEDFFLNYKLGYINEKMRSTNDYLRLQIIDYDKERFFSRFEKYKDNTNENTFKFTIENSQKLKNLLSDIEVKLQNKTPISFGVTNKYVVKFKDIVGYSEKKQKTTDKLLVSTIANTTNITSVFPIPDYFDSFEETKETKEEYRSSIQRTRKSQIDKFNQRYNK